MRQILPAAQYLLQSLRGLRNLSRRCRRHDRSGGDGRAPYITARVICTHDLSPLIGGAACLNNSMAGASGVAALRGDVLGAAHLLRLDQVAASGGSPSYPIATVVYLHFAAAIRRVVGCGGRRAGLHRYVVRIPRTVTLSTL